MFEIMLQTAIGFGYSGIVVVALVSAVRWTMLEREYFRSNDWAQLE